MLPVTKSWAELGYRDIPDHRPPIETGPEWFARQPEAVQRQMLGPAKYAAWKDGAFDLRDLVGRRRNPRWGSMRYERSLREILGVKQAERWMAEAVKAKRMQEEPNRLIRAWLDPKHVPTEAEIEKVLDHVARAPFSTRAVAVDKSLRGQIFQGRKLENKEPSIVAHLAKRVLVNKQWAADVTPTEFIDHLHSAFLERTAKRVVYVGQDKRIYFSVLAPNTIASDRLGPDSQPFVWAVYTADYGTIVTGYQVPRVEDVVLPAKVRWL